MSNDAAVVRSTSKRPATNVFSPEKEGRNIKALIEEFNCTWYKLKGKRVRVLIGSVAYLGTISDLDPTNHRIRVSYDDGDIEWHAAAWLTPRYEQVKLGVNLQPARASPDGMVPPAGSQP